MFYLYVSCFIDLSLSYFGCLLEERLHCFSADNVLMAASNIMLVSVWSIVGIIFCFLLKYLHKCLTTNLIFCDQCPAGRVFQNRVRSGRVLDKIPGSGSGSGQVGVSKNTIGYFRVSFLLSGISGYFGYFWVCRVFLGLPIYTRAIF